MTPACQIFESVPGHMDAIIEKNNRKEKEAILNESENFKAVVCETINSLGQQIAESRVAHPGRRWIKVHIKGGGDYDGWNK
jgi:hypothetical protein